MTQRAAPIQSEVSTTWTRPTLWVGVVALLVYAAGAWWGLPHATTPSTIRGWDIDGLSATGPLSELHNLLVEPKADWNLWYPPGHHFLLAATYAPYLLYLAGTGQVDEPSGTFPFGLKDPLRDLLVLGFIARMVSALMAAATVMMTYAIARRLAGGHAAMAAAAMFSLSVPMIYYARTSNLDVPCLFWTVATTVLLLGGIEWGFTRRRSICVGVCAAAAAATKDQAIMSLVPGLIYVAGVHSHRSEGVRRGWIEPMWAFLSGLGAYALMSGLVLSPHRFLEHSRRVVGLGTEGLNVAFLDLKRPATLDGYLRLAGDVVASLADAWGPVLLVAGALGCACLGRLGPRGRLLLILLTGHLLFFIVPMRHTMVRYALLPCWVLSVGGGVLLARVGAAQVRWRRCAHGIFAVGILWSAVRAADLTRQMVCDARYDAGAWLEEHCAPGDTVAWFGDAAQLPPLPLGVDALRLPADTDARDVLAARRPRFLLLIPDWSSKDDAASRFLDAEVLARVEDGSSGYRLAATLTTTPWTAPFPAELRPVVNPRVRIFTR